MKQRSVILCSIATWLCLALIAALCLYFAPRLLTAYMEFRKLPENIYGIILAAFYVCCVPATVALVCLLRMLGNIRRQKLFDRANIRLLQIISWCCMAVAAVCLVAGFWYFPLFFLTAAMLFIFLIVRVICSLMAAGVALEEENSLTI